MLQNLSRRSLPFRFLLFVFLFSLWMTYNLRFFKEHSRSPFHTDLSASENRFSPVLNRPKRKFSSFPKDGFLLFLHIPKTGGTTIRRSLDNLVNVDYLFVPGAGRYNESRSQVSQYLNLATVRRRKLLFLEIHGRDSPNLLQLVSQLKEWKAQAKTNGIPTFFFTIVREPISFAFSYFNFFHVGRPNINFDQVTPTEANLLKYSNANPQCQFLSHGENILRLRDTPVLLECEGAYQALLETMDWVGTTEKMSQETLVLLQRIVQQHFPANIEFTPERVSRKLANESIARSQVSQEGLQQLEDRSRLDTMLYRRVQRDFPFSMWNFN